MRTVKKAGVFSDLGPGVTGWALETSSNFLLCALCNDLGAIGPKRLLLGEPNSGTGVYTAANASIAGDKPHNPFTNDTAMFYITSPDVVAADKVVSSTFFFGMANGASGVAGAGVGVSATCATGGGPRQ